MDEICEVESLYHECIVLGNLGALVLLHNKLIQYDKIKDLVLLTLFSGTTNATITWTTKRVCLQNTLVH